MIKFGLKVGGSVFEISAFYFATQMSSKEFITDGQANFFITMTSDDIALERIKAAREDELEGLPVRQLSDAQLEITALQRKVTEALFDYDTLLFHGSVVAVDGEAYLFTAKSGTGKSTHTRLWREVFGDRAVMVNDDKPFLKITDQGVIAYGSPWMGKHGLGANISAPLKGICILERGKDNSIRAISAREALPMLFQQSQRPGKPENLSKYMELVDALANRVSFYRMACNMDPEAAVLAHRVMSQSGKDGYNEN